MKLNKIAAECPPLSLPGKPKVLSLQYTGDGDDATSHSQDPSKVTVTGDPNDAAEEYIIGSSKLNQNDSKNKVWFENTVSLDQVFALDPALANDNHLSSIRSSKSLPITL